MDSSSNDYEISRTLQFILDGNYSRVALQFPDELLKDSTRVASVLRRDLFSHGRGNVGIYVLADTTYGSCCVDEVGASHVDADCVVHYGHTCLSPTSTLPALFIFGKSSIDVKACVDQLFDCLDTVRKPIMVLYGLEYAYAVQSIKEAVAERESCLRDMNIGIHFADFRSTIMKPLKSNGSTDTQHDPCDTPSPCVDLLNFVDSGSTPNYSNYKINCSTSGTTHTLGGLVWYVPEGAKMEDYLLFWIGSDNAAFANVVVTYNNSEIVRYDAKEKCLLKDLSHGSKIVKRRYYLVEKAKDANIVGILVGTLGVAGYLHMIHQMKDLIRAAGKKAYLLVMGRPNPAKLANFPECDIFIYVSCAQTALLDSKEFMAPVITPYEATIAFSGGSLWMGAYKMEFRDLISSAPQQIVDKGEARYSFFKGGYVEDLEFAAEEVAIEEEEEERGLVLAEMTKKALKVDDKHPPDLVKREAKSGAEFFASRSYHGLDMHSEQPLPLSYVTGRTGRAVGYEDEKKSMSST
ncbi:hypothetical protein H6P81_004778 [Aristolochia fimbriata]|uniref:2-(3-amino-3-carboxypropyl)histidine synthase subunit 2 n=1 Tax=Aristolochia fimbriata TaxID=158543 RepID=A0AAV7ETA0_ARIFI|nr:hypothetical protein H6P81_004778 [Aristolochia fimbriata]